MATFYPVVLKDQKKVNNTYNVKIRITHNRESKYIKTPYYVVSSQINKKFEIIDPFLYDIVNRVILSFNQEIIKIGIPFYSMSIHDLKEHFENLLYKKDNQIDFVKFARDHISEIKSQGRNSSAMTFNAVVNALVDFAQKDIIDITEINYNFLLKWEKFLTSKRKIIRKDQYDIERVLHKPPLSYSSIFNYMKDLRTLFNQARKHYNDDDKILISHYPFTKYKVGVAPITKRRNLSKEEILSIINYTPQHKLEELGKDMALLSFYLIGANTADIYQFNKIHKNRILYNRSKTKTVRFDRAFISIKVEPEAMEIINKYSDPTGEYVLDLHRRYVDTRNFSKAVNDGLGRISKNLKLSEKVTSYFFRHSWATIARNKCDVDKDVISKALNHSDPRNTVTDIYIEIDWSIIDDANRKVLDYIKN